MMRKSYTLGLKSGNEPEINARAKSQWDEYWFALTGNHWLLGKGSNITKLPKDSNVRATIGFSCNPKKLYHVITLKNVSFAKLSNIMKAIGCDEAINLEGGDGRILAQNGKLKVPGELRSPLIVVYDAEHPAPKKTREAFASFSKSNPQKN
jgi:Phosphodiester glycosidase